jgi:hypothetical protein
MSTYRVEVAGWVVFEAPDDEAARTTAAGLHLGYASDLPAGVVPDRGELVPREPEALG